MDIPHQLALELTLTYLQITILKTVFQTEHSAQYVSENAQYATIYIFHTKAHEMRGDYFTQTSSCSAKSPQN